MGSLKYYCIIFYLFPFSLFSQDTLLLSREESEAIFLKENLQLIAEKLEISQAEAMVAQAKLWPNPTFEIDEVNLWATEKQLAVFGDDLQGFNGGGFGKNQQLSLSVEQLILTAGKRKKLVALEEVSVNQSKEYFEDLLRSLKIEFRNQLTQLQYLQRSQEIYKDQFTSIKKLTAAYKKQLDQGNVGRGEYIRLKALELEISKQISNLEKSTNEVQKELKLLMRLPATVILKIEEKGYAKNIDLFETMSISKLFDTAKENRPDYKLASLEESYYEKKYSYEKSLRVPNLSLKGGYDRGGNFMYNFVGFGLAIDLPFFDRNQGNIKYARLGIEQAQYRFQEKEHRLESEVVLAYQNLSSAIQFFEQIEDGYENTLDELLMSYTNNFTSRNISIIEYLDFLEAYLENKEIILEAIKEINVRAEELNYTVGVDIIPL